VTVTIVTTIIGGSVTVVMVVTVAPYCLHRRKHRYALGTIITQGALRRIAQGDGEPVWMNVDGAGPPSVD